MNEHRLVTSLGRDMPGRTKRPRRGSVVAVCLGLFFVLSLASSFSPAQTSMELTRWKQFSYAKDVKQVGGRVAVLDAVNRHGFIVLGDGEFARLSGWVVHTSSPDGKVYYQGFLMYDFKDGSSILAKVDASGEPRAKQVGTIIFLSGTKRFKGITGRGTISSWMPTQWDMYTEIDASYSVSRD